MTEGATKSCIFVSTYFACIRLPIILEKNSWPGKKILIVEDDHFSLEFLKVSLRNRGLEILDTPDGEEAIRLFRKTPDLDIILLDLQIMTIDGLTVCRKIREENPEIPIIIQTAYAMDKERLQSQQAGCNAYLTKPINLKKLIELMDRYLSQ